MASILAKVNGIRQIHWFCITLPYILLLTIGKSGYILAFIAAIISNMIYYLSKDITIISAARRAD